MIDQPISTSTSVTPVNACPVKYDHTLPRADCDAAPYRLPQFTLQFLALATVLVAGWFAMWPITSIASRVVLAVIVLTYLFGCARTRLAVIVMLPALYVPHLWIFLIQDYPWSDYRWLWAKMFWQLPGVVPVALIRQYWWRGEWRQLAGMVTFSVLIWLAVVTLGRRGGRWLWVTAAVAFALSVACSVIEHSLFRM